MRSQVHVRRLPHERNGGRHGVHDQSLPAGGLGGGCEGHNQKRASRGARPTGQALRQRQGQEMLAAWKHLDSVWKRLHGLAGYQCRHRGCRLRAMGVTDFGQREQAWQAIHHDTNHRAAEPVQVQGSPALGQESRAGLPAPRVPCARSFSSCKHRADSGIAATT